MPGQTNSKRLSQGAEFGLSLDFLESDSVWRSGEATRSRKQRVFKMILIGGLTARLVCIQLFQSAAELRVRPGMVLFLDNLVVREEMRTLMRCCVGVGVAQKQNRDQCVDQQDILHVMALFLAAIAAFLFSGSFGAWDASLRAIMAKRGAVASATAASGTARRWANAANERLGASPNCRPSRRRSG